MGSGFRSDQALDVYKEALRQKWRRPRENHKSGHVYLFCPHKRCCFMTAFSISGDYTGNKLMNQIAVMRRHGFVWRGRGGTHTAQRLHRKAGSNT